MDNNLFSLAGKIKYIYKYSDKVCRFTIANVSGVHTDFINVTCFNTLAYKIGNEYNLDDSVSVLCSLRNNSYTNKEGKKVYQLQVIASDIKRA